MKKINLIILIVAIFAIFSIAVLSQLSPLIAKSSKTTQLTPKISVNESEICNTIFYDEVKSVYGNCTSYNNYTTCLNTTGPNTDCSESQTQINFVCKTGEVTVTSNKTECKPDNNFIITIDNGNAILKKQIDSSEWGPCIYGTENNCLIVTCVSLYDGAHKGQFTNCNGGKSCQKFVICENSIKTYYKNSRSDFVEDDSSFYLGKLSMKEVPQ